MDIFFFKYIFKEYKKATSWFADKPENETDFSCKCAHCVAGGTDRVPGDQGQALGDFYPV